MYDLLIHHGALGDWVLTWPILNALTRQEPAATVVAVTHLEKARLAASLISGVKPLDINHPAFSQLHARGGANKLDPAVRELIEQSRTVISYVSDGEDMWAKNIAKLAPRARLHFIKPNPPAGWCTHVQEWHVSQLKMHGFDLEPVPLTARAVESSSKRIVIHPGSGTAHKCWPPVRFEKLIDDHRLGPFEPRILLGEVEAEKWPPKRLDHWRTDYGAVMLGAPGELLSELRDAALFLGNDSGPTHLAAAIGVPTVALFGPTDPTVWAPRGPRVTVVAPPKPTTMTWLGPDDAARAIEMTWKEPA